MTEYESRKIIDNLEAQTRLLVKLYDSQIVITVTLLCVLYCLGLLLWKVLTS